MAQYFVGVDLGQVADYSAISIVQRHIDHSKQPVTSYDLLHLDRVARGTPYTHVVEIVREMASELSDAVVVLDATGVGLPVLDLFHARGVHPTPVTITGGVDWRVDERGYYYAPKRELVATLQVAFLSKRLRWPSKIDLADVFVRELMAFQVKISDAGHDTYGAWRENIHDDLVLSVAMAVWIGERAPTWLVN